MKNCQKTGMMNLISDMNKATSEEDNEDSEQEPQEKGASTLTEDTHSATLDSLIQSELFGMEK